MICSHSSRALHRAVDPRARRRAAWRAFGVGSAAAAPCARAPVAVGLDRAHERVGHRDADVEVAQIAVVLGVDEVLDVRVVAAQYRPSARRAASRRIRPSRSSGRTRACTRPVRSRASACRAPARPSGGSTRSRSRPRRRGAWSRRPPAARRRCRACRRRVRRPSRPPAARSS